MVEMIVLTFVASVLNINGYVLVILRAGQGRRDKCVPFFCSASLIYDYKA